MGELPAGLLQRWMHSFEEDSEEATVYRPADHPFPPARGRGGMEFAADGAFVDRPVGRGDAQDAVAGRWEADEGGRRLTVTFPGTGRAARAMEIVYCDGQVLKIRPDPGTA
ncbi:hypothetical protein [Streptomyces sp. NPDC050388]|uniref:hypothetical protein n=1 Tax=Streptomyces sp. NPDC050388 TaxID=3155781 RepID=UPI00342A3326